MFKQTGKRGKERIIEDCVRTRYQDERSSHDSLTEEEEEDEDDEEE